MISPVPCRTRKRWLTSTAFACTAILAVACSKEDTLVAPSESVSLPPPSFNATTPPNGSGACLGADAVAGDITSGLAVPGDGSDLNCTSNDVDISQAVITEFRVGNPPAGSFIPLPPGGTIDCLTGETIEAKTVLLVQNNAKARYDLGAWINPDPDEADPTGNGLGAQLGTSCLHFNLVVGQGGSTLLDNTPDSCGDVSAGQLLNIDLETLSFECKDDDGNGTVDIDACAAWHNSTTGAGEVICPLSPPKAGDPTGFRHGTGPETKAKCRCEGLNLPINIKSVLRVTKVTVPDPDPTEPDQEFDFTPTGYGAPFSLSNGETNSSGAIDAGTYSVAETVPTGWDLTNLGSIVCVNTSDSSAHAHTVTSNSVEVELGPGEDVTCTFTNALIPTLKVTKLLDPTDDGGKFDLKIDTVVCFTDAGHNDSCGPQEVTVGSHTVSEAAGTSTDLADYNSVVGGECAPNGSVTLAIGDAKECTITNTLKRGKIIIKKVTDPTGGTGFGFTDDIAAPNNFSLDHGQMKTFDPVLPGQYTVIEDDPTPGFDLTSLSCDDGASDTPSTTSLGTRTATINVEPDETVTCTFTNTQRGTIKITKITDPTGGTGFGYTDDIAAPNSFSLDHGQTKTFSNVVPGSYMATEDDPTPGFDLTALSCDDGASDTPSTTSLGTRKASIELDPGETVECTFTNTQRGTIVIEKVTDPTGATGFGYTDDIAAPNVFSLDHGQSKTFLNVLAGQYMVTEDDPSPTFELSNLVCVDSDGGGTASTWDLGTRKSTINLDPGETVTCTYTNTEVPVCEAGDRLTSVTLKVVSASPDPIQIAWTDDNGNLNSATILGSVASATAGPPGTEFTILPNPGPFFDSQNARFYLGPVGGDLEPSKNLKVHLSCSDDPFIGQQHSGNASGFSATLEKTAFTPTPFNP